MNRQDLLQDKRQIWLRHSGTVSSIADETAGIAEMCRGTKGSNPPPSSGESCKLHFASPGSRPRTAAERADQPVDLVDDNGERGRWPARSSKRFRDIRSTPPNH